jgi:hypothetical protein
MIPVKEMRIELEKNAAGALKDAIKFVKNHPYLTAATIGGVAVIPPVAAHIAKEVLPAYHILNEENKRSIMHDQTKILRQIEQSVNKPRSESVPKTENQYTILKKEPLA